VVLAVVIAATVAPTSAAAQSESTAAAAGFAYEPGAAAPSFPELPGTEPPAIVYEDLGVYRLPPVGEADSAGAVLPASAELAYPAIHAPGNRPPADLELPPESQTEASAAPAVDPVTWEGSVELGLNGSQGNSETLNLRAGAQGRRKGPLTQLSVDINYKRDSKRDDTGWAKTANRLYFDWRGEWLRDESPWSLFVHGTVELDEFQAFDTRVTLDAGVGYQFLKTETMSLLGRFGAGFSREIGGPDDRYVPEALFGLDFEHRLTKRQSLTASVEYFPDWTGFNDFRLTSKVHWKIDIDDESNLSLKVGIIDRYDSTPHDAEANDLDYSVVLLWSF
jgi:putative salt-induced outer membrane protein YdiY